MSGWRSRCSPSLPTPSSTPGAYSLLQGVYSRRLYSVMQSDGNSFCGNVVLDSFNKAYRNEDSILDQIYVRSS